MNFFKKIFLLTIMSAIILSGVFYPNLRVVAWGVGGWVIDPTHIAETIEQTLKELARWAEEDMMKVLRDQIVKIMVDRLTDDIVRSIYNEGDPYYVRDWKSYLGEAGDIAFNDLNKKLKGVTEGVNLCSPFMPNIKVNLRGRLNYGYGRLPLECTFQDFKNNLKNSGHFIESGGWISYDEMLIPSNNYWLTSIMIEDEYNAKVRAEVEARKNEALSSSGFLGMKRCVSYGEYDQAEVRGQCEPGDSACMSSVDEAFCAKWETLTPGDAVAKSATEAIGLDGKYLTNVESIISALVNVMVKKVLDSASGGFSGAYEYDENVGYFDESGTSDLVEEINRSDLNNIINNYEDFINYVNGVLGYINSGIEVASGVSCTSDEIAYIDSNGEEQTSTVGDLLNFLESSKPGFEQALSDAESGLGFMTSFDPSEPGSSSLITIQAIDDYQNLINRYPVINGDLSSISAGGQGGLEVMYKSIYESLYSYITNNDSCTQASLWQKNKFAYLGYKLNSIF